MWLSWYSGNVTLANRVHFTGRHWRGKVRRGLLCGRFFEVTVVHFEFRWLATAPLAAPGRSQAARVSTHPVSASRILLFARATNRLAYTCYTTLYYTIIIRLVLDVYSTVGRSTVNICMTQSAILVDGNSRQGHIIEAMNYPMSISILMHLLKPLSHIPPHSSSPGT